jgi:hypothetical protein
MTIKILTIAQIVHIVQPSNHLWWRLHVVRYYIVCFVRASAFKEITTTSVIFSIIKNRENENNMTAEENTEIWKLILQIITPLFLHN